MSAQHDLQLRLRRHLTEQADPSAAAGQLDAVLAITSTTTQRSRWHASARLAGRGVQLGIPRVSREALVLVGVALLIGLLGLVYLLGHPQPRRPFNGLILFGRFEAAAGDTVVYTVHPDGTGLHQVTPEPAEEPHWSHDGRQILLGDRIVSPTGVVLQRWQLGSGTFHVQCPYFSPDDTRLLCEGFDDNAIADPEVHGIYTVRASDAGDMRRLTAPGTAGTAAGYSPDRGTILFFSINDATQAGPMYLIDADGQNLRRLGDLNVNSASWAPDGLSVLATGQGRLYQVSLATGAARRVDISSIPGAEIVGAVWSPDQTQILFKRLTSVVDLYVMNADGSGVRQITADGAEERFIDWGTHPLDP